MACSRGRSPERRRGGRSHASLFSPSPSGACQRFFGPSAGVRAMGVLARRGDPVRRARRQVHHPQTPSARLIASCGSLCRPLAPVATSGPSCRPRADSAGTAAGRRSGACSSRITRQIAPGIQHVQVVRESQEQPLAAHLLRADLGQPGWRLESGRPKRESLPRIPRAGVM